MSDRPRIYISGPISKGDHAHNFHQAVTAQKSLMEAGCAVLNPMLSMLMPGAFSIPHAEWIANDLPWVTVSDAVLRLPGESDGADAECGWAKDHDIPVYHNLEELLTSFQEPKR